MQSPFPTVADPATREVRAPWPDEMFRLRHFLPEVALCEETPTFLVGVAGRDERIIAAAALATRQTQDARTGLLYLRTEPGAGQTEWSVALARTALERARARGWTTLFLGRSFEENSEIVHALAGLGFTVRDTTEIYVGEMRPTCERLGRLYERLRARGAIPAGVRLSTLQPGLIEPVRQFLRTHMPGGAAMLAVETSGCTPEDSLALLVRGEVKGILLCGRHGPTFTVGLKAVAPELRGGLDWANVLLMLAAISGALQAGITQGHFEANPHLHADTRQFAHFVGAQLLARRVVLAAEMSEQKD